MTCPLANSRFLGLSFLGRTRRRLGSVIANTFLRFKEFGFHIENIRISDAYGRSALVGRRTAG
jgi:hypothetical protein